MLSQNQQIFHKQGIARSGCAEDRRETGAVIEAMQISLHPLTGLDDQLKNKNDSGICPAQSAPEPSVGGDRGPSPRQNAWNDQDDQGQSITRHEEVMHVQRHDSRQHEANMVLSFAQCQNDSGVDESSGEPGQKTDGISTADTARSRLKLSGSQGNLDPSRRKPESSGQLQETELRSRKHSKTLHVPSEGSEAKAGPSNTPTHTRPEAVGSDHSQTSTGYGKTGRRTVRFEVAAQSPPAPSQYTRTPRPKLRRLTRSDVIFLKSVGIVFACYLVSWLPILIVEPLRYNVHVSADAYGFCLWLLSVSSSINRIVYGLTLSRFRRGYNRAFSRCKCCLCYCHQTP
ncbi:hypothetical protein BaRGS_00020867 [Batillaria attramentaria]|uniref:G-protein coupled receptors family 1 profile domain-containing protein n=1 Tax=Batillaria attramentaria TaxID=370345 RepID=A0ABD0KLM8_9CAEN